MLKKLGYKLLEMRLSWNVVKTDANDDVDFVYLIVVRSNFSFLVGRNNNVKGVKINELFLYFLFYFTISRVRPREDQPFRSLKWKLNVSWNHKSSKLSQQNLEQWRLCNSNNNSYQRRDFDGIHKKSPHIYRLKIIIESSFDLPSIKMKYSKTEYLRGKNRYDFLFRFVKEGYWSKEKYSPYDNIVVHLW